jgi:UDP-N-acetylglucosamine 3-dehydrogenase
VAEQLERVRVALIGLGAIGRLHAAVLAASRAARLVVCADVDPERRAGCPEGIPFVEEPGRALDEFELDAVVVATPEGAHREVAEAALARGLAVLCEKPIAGTLADADAMIHAAAASGALLAIGHVSRFDPRHVALADAVAAGSLGPALHLAARRVSAGERDYYAPRTTLAVELGVHDLDLFRWLAGEIERVYGAISRRDGLADSMVGTIEFRSGAVGTVELSWALPTDAGIEWEHELTYVGRGGFARVDGRTRGLSLHLAGGARHPDVLMLHEVHGRPAGLLAIEDEHFVACVAERREWPVSPADARAALAAALALDASAERGEPVRVAA